MLVIIYVYLSIMEGPYDDNIGAHMSFQSTTHINDTLS